MLNERHSSRIWKTPRKASSNGAPVGDRLWTLRTAMVFVAPKPAASRRSGATDSPSPFVVKHPVKLHPL